VNFTKTVTVCHTCAAAVPLLVQRGRAPAVCRLQTNTALLYLAHACALAPARQAEGVTQGLPWRMHVRLSAVWGSSEAPEKGVHAALAARARPGQGRAPGAARRSAQTTSESFKPTRAQPIESHWLGPTSVADVKVDPQAMQAVHASGLALEKVPDQVPANNHQAVGVALLLHHP
jgi:hypothetical protein